MYLAERVPCGDAVDGAKVVDGSYDNVGGAPNSGKTSIRQISWDKPAKCIQHMCANGVIGIANSVCAVWIDICKRIVPGVPVDIDIAGESNGILLDKAS